MKTPFMSADVIVQKSYCILVKAFTLGIKHEISTDLFIQSQSM